MIEKSEIVIPNVYAIKYDTQYDLCMSFVRMQEFYESASSKIRGKYFTLEDYMDYWASEFGNGSFDYPKRWNGFNLPSNVIERWRGLFEGQGCRLRDREYEILDAIDELGHQELVDEEPPDKYYVIGVHAEKSEKDRLEVIRHESAHALYYLFPAYKRAANKLIKEIPKEEVEDAKERLIIMGYGSNILKDEMQAYFSTEEGKGYIISLSGRQDFAENFNKYSKKWIEKNIKK